MADTVLGRLIYRITGDTSQLDSSVNRSNTNVKGFGKSLSGLGKLIRGAAVTGAIIIAGRAVAKFGKSIILASSDAEETQNKFSVVFKSISEEAEAASKNLSVNFGLSSTAAKTLLADSGDLLTGFGFTQESALGLSTQINELAVDLASFTNFSGGAAGASAALNKAVLGERESLKALGISILEADVKTKVLELTQQGMTFETERQAKAYATLLLAQSQSLNAIGDFERSSSSFANQTRITTARMEDLKVVMGDQLLPVANVAVGLFNDLLASTLGVAEGVGKFAESEEGVAKISKTFGVLGGTLTVLKDIIVTLFDSVVGVFEDIITPLDDLDVGLGDASSEFTILGVAVQLATGVLSIFGKIIGGAVSSVVSLANVIVDTGAVIGDFFGLITGKTSVAEFKESVDEVKDSFVDMGKGLVGSYVDLFKEVGTQVVDFTGKAQESAEDFEKAYTDAAGNIQEKVKNSLEQADDDVKDSNNTQLEDIKKKEEAELALIRRTATERLTLQLNLEEALIARDKRRAAAAKEAAEKEIELRKEVAQFTVDFALDSFSAITSIADQRATNARAALTEFEAINDAEVASLEEKASSEEGLTDAEAARLDDLNAQKKALAQEQYDRELAAFNTNKAFRIAETIITGFNAAVNAFNSLAVIPVVGPALGIAAAGAVGIFTGIQVGGIAAQTPPPPPSFANGGIVPGRPSRTDNTTANVASGELVANQGMKDTMLMEFLKGGGSKAGQMIHLTVNIGKKAILDTVAQGTKDGTLIIDARSVK